MITGNEIIKWKSINEYEGLYEISNCGLVRSIERGIIYKNGVMHLYPSIRLALSKNIDGYLVVGLTKGKIQKQYRVSRLVAEHFILNPLNLPEVNHLDYNKLNNWYWNLEWCDKFRQQQHSAKKPGRKFASHFRYNTGKLNHKSKPLFQFKNGCLVREFESANMAAKELGLLQCKISSCYLGKRKSHGGYEFKFKQTI